MRSLDTRLTVSVNSLVESVRPGSSGGAAPSSADATPDTPAITLSDTDAADSRTSPGQLAEEKEEEEEDEEEEASSAALTRRPRRRRSAGSGAPVVSEKYSDESLEEEAAELDDESSAGASTAKPNRCQHAIRKHRVWLGSQRRAHPMQLFSQGTHARSRNDTRLWRRTSPRQRRWTRTTGRP